MRRIRLKLPPGEGEDEVEEGHQPKRPAPKGKTRRPRSIFHHLYRTKAEARWFFHFGLRLFYCFSSLAKRYFQPQYFPPLGLASDEIRLRAPPIRLTLCPGHAQFLLLHSLDKFGKRRFG